jgi:hypothetical protein
VRQTKSALIKSAKMSTQLSLVKTEKLKAKDDTPLSLYMLRRLPEANAINSAENPSSLSFCSKAKRFKGI